MGDTAITTRLPLVQLATTNVPPPAAAYITPDDILWVRAWCSAPGVVIGVLSRILLPDGSIVASQDAIALTSDRSLVSASIRLPEGWLLGLAVGQNVGPAPWGQLYVQVELAHGAMGGVPITAQELVAGYCGLSRFLSWPPYHREPPSAGAGALRSVTGTDPAAGVEISETVPANTRWKVLCIRFTLVTDATVGARSPRLIVDDGATTLLLVETPVTQAASTTWSYNAGSGLQARNPLIVDATLPLPVPLLLASGWRLRTSTSNFQAGDNYGAPQMLVQEWLQP